MMKNGNYNDFKLGNNEKKSNFEMKLIGKKTLEVTIF